MGRVLRMEVVAMRGRGDQQGDGEEDAVENDMRVMGFEKGIAPCFLLAVCLIHLIEDWRSKLDNDYFVGVMDLSKAFDCIPHDLHITKLHALVISKSFHIEPKMASIGLFLACS